ncbi:reverse transcriptase domain-containing protein [Kitasatospora sp. NPDC056138]|uniref:reverse transcriptase domain-containing protein n=1 Tax=Kitasatospora sp. NPDC056138 TaxID=3345724 RepID=UPI0035D56D15
MTFLPTGEGWLYLATVIDLATREVVGHAMADHRRAELPLAALRMAAGRGSLERGCSFHSDRLLNAIGEFPGRELVRQWLKAGVIDGGRFTRTDEGTPRGGVISPRLLNIALHGMEEAAGVRFATRKGKVMWAAKGTPILVRYADDFAVFCTSREEAETAKARLTEWLAPRGLRFNEEKTRILHLPEEFDFLGFTVRRHGDALIITPSKDAVARVRKRLRDEMQALLGLNVTAVLRRLSPIVRGWSAYYRTVVSSRTFSALDSYVWALTYKRAKRSHMSPLLK